MKKALDILGALTGKVALPRCSAVIVAAGNSTRMGGTVSKQFLLLSKMPVLARTLRAFEDTALIREKTPLSSIDFDLMLEKPQLMAFSKRDRQIRMGGARL